ncbi:hypothetical protein X975_00350, partial [Stegodyphus mimosarum]
MLVITKKLQDLFLVKVLKKYKIIFETSAKKVELKHSK